MAIIPQPFLFSWKEIDEASDLDRLRLVLSALPDESLVCFLEQRRGRGRDDYPIRSMWNAVIAGVVFQHPSAAALLRELRRNGELRQLCGFNPFGGEASAPSDDAMERFLKLIVEHSSMLTGMFHELVDELKKHHKKIHKDTKKLSPIGIGDFGRVVRAPIELDRRIFTPIARPTDKWHKAYNLRTSVERVNGRIDQVLGFELHNIRGKAKMEMRVTLALVVMLAMALGRIRTGQSDKMRSLTAPAARAA